MNNDKLEKIIYVMSDTMSGESGAWEFVVGDIVMICLTDETNNRMRIITPIKHQDEVTKDELSDAMEANFHTALDVKYALADGLMWVAYIHPLSELSKNQTVDAITQVYNAAITFGTTYTSSGLVFPKSEKVETSKRKIERKS